MQRQLLVEKAEKAEEIKSLIQKYRAVGIVSLHKVRASQLQKLRRMLEGTAHLQVVKNTLMQRAISTCQGKPEIEKLKEHLEGPNLFLFTNLNPFKLFLILEKSKVKDFAKAGDIATEDVVVPAGNTGLSPGPIISQLGSVGIRTRIESGSVWVNRDTVVARKGEVISESLAPVLSKLGIKPVEMGLTLNVVYDDGVVIPQIEVRLDLDEYMQTLAESQAQAMNLSLSIAYPTAENISTLIQIAAAETHNLALNAGVPSSETIADLVRKAYAEAVALASKVPEPVGETTA